MDSQAQDPEGPVSNSFKPRQAELDDLAKRLPLRGIESSSNRVFNLWGENGVGKSTFISEFRESELMQKHRVLWIQPTRDDSPDTIPEFIRFCSKTVRYPSDPGKEKKIAERLESAERGKVNPIVSDDSLLITRSSLANEKKPYVNKAAAASVGRTEVVRDDAEVNVGLGESKATNHAEGFLDALPLQALGTDLTILYIESLDKLSVSVLDWLRDYVFPAATRGPYRRSLVLLIESLDPLKLAYPNENWGEWSQLTEDYRLLPLRASDTHHIGATKDLDPDTATFLDFKSLGYPAKVHQLANELQGADRSSARAFLDALTPVDQLKIAALSLPNQIVPEELDVLFGASKGTTAYQWFAKLPNNHSKLLSDGKSLELEDGLRIEAIARFKERDEFKEFAENWIPMGRLTQKVPDRKDRSRLMLLSGLDWLDDTLIHKLFGDRAGRIMPFLLENPNLFNRDQERYRVSERFRSDLQQAGENASHAGMIAVRQKAEALWQEKQTELETQITQLEGEIDAISKEIQSLSHRQREIAAQIRIQERATQSGNPSPSNGGLFAKLLNLGGNERKENSPEGLRHLSHEANQKIHKLEQRSDELENALQAAKSDLRYPYV